jgi:Na+-driven multidrug efflux pump
VKLTVSFIKISVIMTALGMVLLLSVPKSVFLFVFPESFHDVKLVIASLAPGIVMLSGSIIFSGFFSAIKAPRHNMISSAAGLPVTIAGGLLLVPYLGLPGAGLAASLTYSVITIWQFVVFLRLAKMSPGIFLPHRNEIRQVISEVKKMAG